MQKLKSRPQPRPFYVVAFSAKGLPGQFTHRKQKNRNLEHFRDILERKIFPSILGPFGNVILLKSSTKARSASEAFPVSSPFYLLLRRNSVTNIQGKNVRAQTKKVNDLCTIERGSRHDIQEQLNLKISSMAITVAKFYFYNTKLAQ